MISLLHARELEMAKHHIEHSSVYPLLLWAMPMQFEAFDPRWCFIKHGASNMRSPPLTHASRQLRKHELNYPTHDLELAAVHYKKYVN